MTSATPSPLRYLAILVFIGLPAAMLTLTILNALQVATDRLSIAENETQIAALTRRLQARPQSGPDPTQAIYITGASRTGAIADLQQRLVTAVSSASGRLIETAAVDTTETDESSAVDRIKVRVTLDIDNDGLLDLLYGLESGVPFIDIEGLSIRMLPSDEGRLRVDMRTIARWKKEGRE